MKIASLAVLAVASVLVLSGCAQEGNSAAKNAIDTTLDAQSPSALATVDFDELVDGEWSQLFIFCRDASPESIDESLGFEWTYDGKDLHGSRTQLLVFATENEVEKFVKYTVADDGVLWCSSQTPGVSAAPTTYSVSRDDAVIELQLLGAGEAGNQTERPMWLRLY